MPNKTILIDKDFADISASNPLPVAMGSGTSILGKVGIDQTTDGTTNKISATQSNPDNLNCNANIQVSNVDVSYIHPVPVQSIVIPTTHRATNSTGAINSTLTPSSAFQLLEVRLHLSDVGGAGNFTMTLDSGTNAAYDVVIVTQDMTSVKDYVFQPDFPMHFDNGDALVFAFPNASNRTYGLEVKYKTL